MRDHRLKRAVPETTDQPVIITDDFRRNGFLREPFLKCGNQVVHRQRGAGTDINRGSDRKWAGWLIRIFYSEKGKSRDRDPDILKRFLKDIRRKIKAAGPMFLPGIPLTALYQIHVPKDFVSGLFGKNNGFGALMAATIGAPVCLCCGATIPPWIQSRFMAIAASFRWREAG